MSTHYQALSLVNLFVEDVPAARDFYRDVLDLELVMEDGDLVACRWRGRAVHRGELLGVPASGSAVETTGITIFRFVGDLISEEWTEFDGLGLLAQVLLISSSPIHLIHLAFTIAALVYLADVRPALAEVTSGR